MTTHIIRDAQPRDFPRVVELNTSFVKFTSEISLPRIAELDRLSCYHTVVECQGQVVAFLLALDAQQEYDSINYQWFRQNCSDFMYIDRIVIDEAQQGRGLGTLLYQDLFKFAKKQGYQRVACEFDIQPANVVSARFHQGFDFAQVGTQVLSKAKKTVSLQVADV
jgi:predicted GNAT superfamily acetyltransferase